MRRVRVVVRGACYRLCWRPGAFAVALVSASLVLGTGAGQAALPRVEVVDIGSLSGTQTYYGAEAVNASGQVVGDSYIAGSQDVHPFFWTAAGGIVDLGALSGAYTSYYTNTSHVNASGQVAGTAITDGHFSHGFFWTQAGGMVGIPAFGGDNSTVADLNDAGQVVGSADGPHGVARAFLWTAAGGILDLGDLGGGTSLATAVNASGQVVGLTTATVGGNERGFSWTIATGMTDIGNLGGTRTIINNLNDNGQIVGTAFLAGDRVQHAFSWTQLGGMVDLGTLGGTESTANLVNANGQVVGTSTLAGDRVTHAFSWTPAGGMVDLGTLGGSTSIPLDLNDNGQVVGQAYLAGDLAGHAFSWTTATGMVDLGGPQSGAYGVNNRGDIVGITITGDSASSATLWRVSTSDTVDANADGVVDTLQPSGTAAGSFTDASLSPPTFGSIVDRGGLTVTVADAADPADGVLVTVGTGSGRATLSMCGGAFTMRISAGSSAILTCGSIRVKTLTGEVDVILGGGITTVALPAPSTARVSDTGGGRYTVQDLGTTPVSVTTSGVTSTVAGGSSSTVAVVTIANICSLTATYVKGSAKYAALTAKQRQTVDQLAAAACAKVAKLTPRLTAKQRAAVIADYKAAVNALASSGWITAAQATTLVTLANTL